MLVALALGIALTLLFAARPVAAGGPYDFLVPLVLEEFRTPPDIIADDLPSVRDVQAQQTSPTSTTLVSNANQGTPGNTSIGSAQATSFTTGSNSSAYWLTSVTMGVITTGTVFDYSVSIRANSSGKPAETLDTLTKSGSLTATQVTEVEFPASGGGIELAANRTYWLVASVNSSVTLVTTEEDDQIGEAGWSIGDDRLSNSPNWDNSDNHSLAFTVKGYAIDRPSQTPRDPILVTYNNAEVEIRAASADRDTLLDYFEDECGRTGRGDEFNSDQSCAFHKLYVRQSGCDSDDWRARNPHLLNDLCPTYRTW